MAIFRKNDMDAVTKRIRQFIAGGELHLPADYSPENAMKSAWLMLQETVDRDKRPARKSAPAKVSTMPARHGSAG